MAFIWKMITPTWKTAYFYINVNILAKLQK